ncbi:MAG: hypothetical protein U1F67_12190 [Rubrivivax sp.]
MRAIVPEARGAAAGASAGFSKLHSRISDSPLVKGDAPAPRTAVGRSEAAARRTRGPSSRSRRAAGHAPPVQPLAGAILARLQTSQSMQAHGPIHGPVARPLPAADEQHDDDRDARERQLSRELARPPAAAPTDPLSDMRAVGARR